MVAATSQPCCANTVGYIDDPIPSQARSHLLWPHLLHRRQDFAADVAVTDVSAQVVVLDRLDVTVFEKSVPLADAMERCEDLHVALVSRGSVTTRLKANNHLK